MVAFICNSNSGQPDNIMESSFEDSEHGDFDHQITCASCAAEIELNGACVCPCMSCELLMECEHCEFHDSSALIVALGIFNGLLGGANPKSGRRRGNKKKGANKMIEEKTNDSIPAASVGAIIGEPVVDDRLIDEVKTNVIPEPADGGVCEEKVAEWHKINVKGKPKGDKPNRAKPVKGDKPNESKFRFYAIRQHKNKAYPPITYRLQQGKSYTQKKIDIINEYHPCTLDQMKVAFRDNEHPLCAAIRSIGEAWMVNAILSETADYKLPPLEDGSLRKILDVGGAASRHHSNKRDKFVHSCIPKFDGRDSIRAFRLPGKAWCHHTWQTCDCNHYLASMSVHSLYYLKEPEILERLLKQEVPIHYALIHFYDNDSGTIMDGEMIYKSKKGLVWAKAKGNLTYYCHRNTDWLRVGHYNDDQGTLEWEIARRFEDSYVLRFIAVAAHFDAPPLPPCEEEKEVPLEAPEIPITDVYDDIVKRSISYGSAINAKNFQQFLHKVNRKGNEKGLDTEELAAYAALKYKNQPMIVPELDESFIEKCKEKMSRLRFDYVVPNWALAIGTLLVSSVSAVLWFGFSRELMALLLLYNFVGSIAATHAVATYDMCRTKKHFLPTNLWLYFKRRVQVLDYCCTLPDRLLDPSKLIRFEYPPDYGESCEARPVARPMIYKEDTTPYFPRNCVHNQVSCLRNKLLHDIGDVGKYNLPLHEILIDVAKKIAASIEPLTWDGWVGRFPNAKQSKLRSEYEHNVIDKIVDWNVSSVFSKFEAMPEPKYPRPVVASEVEFNFQMGRWLVPLGELFSELLPPNILFPIHGDAVEIGQFFDEHSGNFISMGDFTSYDSSQRDEALTSIAGFYRLCGIPSDVVERELLDLKRISIKTRKGLKAVIKGMRCSGRSSTLIGNTVLTINMYLNIFGTNLVALLVKGDDSVPFTREQPDKDSVEKQFRDVGILVKFENTSKEEAEFCSSIFVPYLEGSILTPKPGKILAKTFWCKHMHYSDDDMKDQFVSIAKGLEKSLSTVPGIKGLYDNPLYKSRYNHVHAHYEEYNEYSTESFTPCDETVSFLCDRYGLDPSMLDELEAELKKGFPIKLESHASSVMIERDWASPSINEGLVITSNLDQLMLVISPITEEVLKFYFPPVALIIGIIEWVMTGNPVNMLLHFMFMMVGQCSLLTSIILHLGYNLICCRHQLNLFSLIQNMPRSKKVKKVVTDVVVYKAPKKQKKKKSNKNRKSLRMNVSQFALSRLNPFLAEAEGCKNPDDYGYPTATAICRASFTAGTDSNGHMALGFIPMLTSWLESPLSIASNGTITWAGGSFNNPMPQLNSMQNLAAAYRTVSWGVRITGEVALTAASGHLWVAHIPFLLDQTFPYADWPVNEAGYSQMPLAEKYSVVELCEKPLILSARQMDSGANRFRVLGQDEKTVTNVGDESTIGWSSIGVYGAGLPASTSVLNIEIVMHIEYIHDSSTAYGFITSLPSPYDPGAVEQGSMISAGAPISYVESTVDNVEKAMDLASRIVYKTAAIGYQASRMIGGANKFAKSIGMGRTTASGPLALGWR